MKKTILLVFATLFSLQLLAQHASSIPSYTYVSNYLKGRYYTSDGKMIEGFIDDRNNTRKISFKETKKGKKTVINIEDIISLVTTDTIRVVLKNTFTNREYEYRALVDSFVVKAIEKPGKSLYLAEVLCDISAIKLYRKSYPANSTGTATRIHYEKDDVTFELTKGNYKTILTTAFADIPEIATSVKDLKFKDVENKIVEYLHRKGKPKLFEKVAKPQSI